MDSFKKNLWLREQHSCDSISLFLVTLGSSDHQNQSSKLFIFRTELIYILLYISRSRFIVSKTKKKKIESEGIEHKYQRILYLIKNVVQYIKNGHARYLALKNKEDKIWKIAFLLISQ